MLGFNWPHADEDKMMECAQVWRDFAAEIAEHQARGRTYASNVLGENSGDAIEGFSKAWEKLGGNSGYLNDAREAAEIIAFTFEAAAMLVLGMKVAVIVQLVILATEIIAAQAAPRSLSVCPKSGARRPRWRHVRRSAGSSRRSPISSSKPSWRPPRSR